MADVARAASRRRGRLRGGSRKELQVFGLKMTRRRLQEDAPGGRTSRAEGSLPTGNKWKPVLERQRGDESAAQASLLALILHGKYLAMIAAGVGTNPFN